MSIKSEMSLLGFGSRLTKSRKGLLLKIIVFLPLLLIFAILYYGYNSFLFDRNIYKESLEVTNNSRAILLNTLISENFKKAKIQTRNVKSAIIKELDMAYEGDKDKMKKDYDSKDPTTPFYQILSKNIENKYMNKVNDENRMFIANRQGVLIDNSLKYHSNSSKTWEEIFDQKEFKNLAKLAIQHITSCKEDNAILWVDQSTFANIKFEERENTYSDTHALEFIEKSIENGTIDELENYSIIAVSYIMNHSDIFGVPDIEVGQRLDNDKIYIIQVLSIKDMINSDHTIIKALDDFDDNINAQERNMNSSMFYKTLIIFLISGIGVFTFFGVWYLAEFYCFISSGNRIEDFQ